MTITSDLKTIETDIKNVIKVSKNRDTYNTRVVDRLIANGLKKYFLRIGTLKRNSPRTETIQGQKTHNDLETTLGLCLCCVYKLEIITKL